MQTTDKNGKADRLVSTLLANKMLAKHTANAETVILKVFLSTVR